MNKEPTLTEEDIRNLPDTLFINNKIFKKYELWTPQFDRKTGAYVDYPDMVKIDYLDQLGGELLTMTYCENEDISKPITKQELGGKDLLDIIKEKRVYQNNGVKDTPDTIALEIDGREHCFYKVMTGGPIVQPGVTFLQKKKVNKNSAKPNVEWDFFYYRDKEWKALTWDQVKDNDINLYCDLYSRRVERINEDCDIVKIEYNGKKYTLVVHDDQGEFDKHNNPAAGQFVKFKGCCYQGDYKYIAFMENGKYVTDDFLFNDLLNLCSVKDNANKTMQPIVTNPDVNKSEEKVTVIAGNPLNFSNNQGSGLNNQDNQNSGLDTTTNLQENTNNPNGNTDIQNDKITVTLIRNGNTIHTSSFDSSLDIFSLRKSLIEEEKILGEKEYLCDGNGYICDAYKKLGDLANKNKQLILTIRSISLNKNQYFDKQNIPHSQITVPYHLQYPLANYYAKFINNTMTGQRVVPVSAPVTNQQVTIVPLQTAPVLAGSVVKQAPVTNQQVIVPRVLYTNGLHYYGTPTYYVDLKNNRWKNAKKMWRAPRLFRHEPSHTIEGKTTLVLQPNLIPEPAMHYPIKNYNQFVVGGLPTQSVIQPRPVAQRLLFHPNIQNYEQKYLPQMSQVPVITTQQFVRPVQVQTVPKVVPMTARVMAPARNLFDYRINGGQVVKKPATANTLYNLNGKQIFARSDGRGGFMYSNKPIYDGYVGGLITTGIAKYYYGQYNPNIYNDQSIPFLS